MQRYRSRVQSKLLPIVFSLGVCAGGEKLKIADLKKLCEKLELTLALAELLGITSELKWSSHSKKEALKSPDDYPPNKALEERSTVFEWSSPVP